MQELTIKGFVAKYTNTNKLTVSETSVRNFVKENKEDLLKENIIKEVMKLKSSRITIIDSNTLLLKING